MPSEANPLPTVDWTRRTEPADLPEWMDEPCSFEDLQACLLDLSQTNRLTLGYRPTLSFLERLVATRTTPQPLRVLDVGSGGGDMLHRIAGWAKARRIPVDLTGIDLNPHAAKVAAARFPDLQARWITGDALHWQGSADVVISSLLTHHLASDEIVRFLHWMEATATLGWFVNDLERSARSARLFSLLSRIMRWHRFVQHDGPVSLARSFRREDWERMLSVAGLPHRVAEIAQHFPARLCVGRLK